MTLKLNGSSSGYTAIDAPASAGSNTLVLPADNGSANEVLQTNGSGALSWAGNTPAFAARVGTQQDFTTNSTVVVDFDTEILDSDSCFDTSTHRFTPNSAGYYYIYMSIYICGSENNKIEICHGNIVKNNTTNIARGRHDPNDSYEENRANVSCSGIVYLNGSSDYIDGQAYGKMSSGDVRIDDEVSQCLGGFKLLGV